MERYKRLNCSTKYMYIYVFPLSILLFSILSHQLICYSNSCSLFVHHCKMQHSVTFLFCYHYAYGSSNDIGDIFRILLFLFAKAFTFYSLFLTRHVCVSSTTKMVNIKQKRGSTAQVCVCVMCALLFNFSIVGAPISCATDLLLSFSLPLSLSLSVSISPSSFKFFPSDFSCMPEYSYMRESRIIFIVVLFVCTFFFCEATRSIPN